MQFRYDIGEKLDLSQFKKQVERHIRTNSDNLFEFYMRDFIVEIRSFYCDIPVISMSYKREGVEFEGGIRVTVRIFDIKRVNSEIIDKKEIRVLYDERFNIFPQIQAMFHQDELATSIVKVEDIHKILDSIHMLLTILYKLGKLKAFS